MNEERFGALLRNAYAMAEDLTKCPANEQNFGNALACMAQAIRDLAEAIRENSNAYTNNMRKKF